MRQSFIIILFISTFACSAQSLFFDNLKNSTWTSEKIYFDSKMKSAKEISLTKHADKDTLNVNKTLWVFGDSLAIRLYSVKSHCVSDISRHKYIVNKDKGLLQIVLSDNITLTYKVGIVSTGNHALLFRQ